MTYDPSTLYWAAMKVRELIKRLRVLAALGQALPDDPPAPPRPKGDES